MSRRQRFRLLSLVVITLVAVSGVGLARADGVTDPGTDDDFWQEAASVDIAPNQPAPSGIALDGLGNVYVTDYTGDRVLRFSTDGTLTGGWGSFGTGPGQFSGPFGISVTRTGSAVYVVDQLNDRVQAFGPDGTFVSQWGVPGAGIAQLRTPFGASLSNGHLYVADFGNDRIQVFTVDGQPAYRLGVRGSDAGELLRPAGVAVDLQDGTIYVSDHFNDRVQHLDAAGRFLGLVGLPGPGTQTAATNPAAALGFPPVVPGPAGPALDGQISRPEGLALNREGDLFVDDYGHDRVARFGPDGHIVSVLGARGSDPGSFMGPKGIDVDPTTQRVFVADTGNSRIERFAPDGTLETYWPLPPY